MKAFNVLDRHLDLHHHHLIEASAGTGKTFSIENIVLRLLLETKNEKKMALSIDQILVVTFTRAATRDLKSRIRSNIEKALKFLYDSSYREKKNIPDYLLYYFEKGEGEVAQATRVLENALYFFDDASIFTIHGFCAKMLRDGLIEGDTDFDPSLEGSTISFAERIKIIRDVFRTQIYTHKYSTQQLKILLKGYQNDIEKLEKKLSKAMRSSIEIAAFPHFNEDYESFCFLMHKLKYTFKLHSQGVMNDFDRQIIHYKKSSNKSLYEDLNGKIKRFACLFDKEMWTQDEFDQLIGDGLVFVECLDPDLFKVKAKHLPEISLQYPGLIEALKENLYPLICQARHPTIIFTRLMRDCQLMFKRFLLEEEKLGPDDLLFAMAKALKNSVFVNAVQQKYRVVIVDEFQDTDPIQWEIFQRLFLQNEWSEKNVEVSSTGKLFLVGDPKQAIYSFRQADIYTYLKAAQAIPLAHHVSLNTNYRSQAALIQGLNFLLSESQCPGLITLPLLKKDLPIPPVEFSFMRTPKIFQDGLGAIHFFIASNSIGRGKKWPSIEMQQQCFFPYIAQEIDKLVQKDGLSFNQHAVLVRDRYQAQSLAAFFRQLNIPYVCQQSSLLTDSHALHSMIDLFNALINPHDRGAMKVALGSKIIGWTHEQIIQFQEGCESIEFIEMILKQFRDLRECLYLSGMAQFTINLLHSAWHAEGRSVIEYLLLKQEGIDFYSELMQIFELLIEYQLQTQASPERLVQFLRDLENLFDEEDEQLKVSRDPCKEGVKILTLHASKGLEFDVVFALGLVNRYSLHEDELISIRSKENLCLKPLKTLSETEKYQHFCEVDAEKARLLYVAMTRAKYRLYLPAAVETQQKEILFGTASPMEIFLGRLGKPRVSSQQELYRWISEYQQDDLCTFLMEAGKKVSISYSLLNKKTSNEKASPNTFYLEDQNPLDLIPPSHVKIPENPLYLHSFSSLIRNAKKRPMEEGLGDDEEKIKLQAPQDYSVEIKTPHNLPAGRETGIMLHHILETLPFDAVKSAVHPDALLSHVSPFLKENLLNPWQNVICAMIFHALKTPLFTESSIIRLCDVEMNDCYRELEVLFPCDNFRGIEGFQYSSGYLKGVIDFIFKYEDKYYFVDWKSNWLGNQLDDYKQENLEREMMASRYDLQSSIYVEALKRYFKIVDERSFEECFGGFFYLFLRGINPTEGLQHGIYWKKNPFLTLSDG